MLNAEQDPSVYKRVLSSIDNLHRDTSWLFKFVEKKMKDEKYKADPSEKKVVWNLRERYNTPDQWRARHVARFYRHSDSKYFKKSLFVLLDLGVAHPYEFPPLICGHMVHPEKIQSKVLYRKEYRLRRIRSLISTDPAWENFRESDGWIIASPKSSSPFSGQVSYSKFYILNLFNLTNKDSVFNYIITPLTQEDDEASLKDVPVTTFIWPGTE